ncbi:MAG: hypothetical protein CFH43_01152 [Proteobacteria bacterium]|nr:MAG: hypothetical protein CFH43_01152 [Pseudomonadota bacterium]
MHKKHIEATIQSLTQLILNHPINKDVDERLFYAGWKPINGTGVFSAIFKSPCKRFVLRLGHDDDETLKDSYPYHATNCIFNPKNPYYQKVYWHVFHIEHEAGKMHKTLTITLMEPLKRVNLSETAVRDMQTVCRALVNKYEYNPYAGKPIVFKNKNMEKAVSHIQSTKEKYDLLYDTSKCNFMLRGKHQLVILDPLQ